MENLTINTGLDRFLLLDRITEVDEKNIKGVVSLSDEHAYLLIEALAQLGAMHVRFITDFSGHAFLLGISKCHISEKKEYPKQLNLSGTLRSQSSNGFSYSLHALIEGKSIIYGNFLFATTPYDHNFKLEYLKKHYQKVFSCLQNE